MTPVSRRSFLLTGGTATAAGATATLLAPSALASPRKSPSAPGGIYVAAGQTYTVAATTRVPAVTIEQGGVLTAPAGHSLTMTVNSVETGQALTATSGSNTAFVAGAWRGDIVLTVATEYDVAWQHTYPFCQAIYADSAGVVAGYSVLAAAVGGKVGSASANGVRIASTGECFDGVVVEGGSFALSNSVIRLRGNGRCDFVGYGAAVLANNTGTRVVLDGVTIDNAGAVRTAAISDNGATLVVKNSSLSVKNGTLPSDYVPSVNLDTTPAPTAPWSRSTARSATQVTAATAPTSSATPPSTCSALSSTSAPTRPSSPAAPRLTATVTGRPSRRSTPASASACPPRTCRPSARGPPWSTPAAGASCGTRRPPSPSAAARSSTRRAPRS